MKLSKNKEIPVVIQKLLAARKYDKALLMLESSISNSGGLFSEDIDTFELRRATWLMRIDILRNIGRYAEALAWTCLECELNPENITAAALKNQLLKGLNLENKNVFSSNINSNNDFQSDWKGVAGMRQLKSFLETEIVLPILERSLYDAYKIPVPSGIIFYGPPGCGKTFLAQKLAERVKRKYFITKPSDFASIYVHGTQEKIKEYFETIEKAAPCVIILDELDAMLPDRKSDISHSFSSEVNEFLVHLDKAASKDILVIGTTNHIDKIDLAALRPGRFDLKVHVDVPDFEARTEMLVNYMQERPQEFIDWELVAENTEGYSYSELKLLVDRVAKSALISQEKINMKQFYKALKLN